MTIEEQVRRTIDAITEADLYITIVNTNRYLFENEEIKELKDRMDKLDDAINQFKTNFYTTKRRR